MTQVIKRNERSFAAGELIFEEGQVGDFAYVLVSGELEICKLIHGEYTKLMDVKEGTMFGEMALIDKSERSASARAVSDVVVREIDEKALMAHIKKSPDVAMNMMYRLANYARTSTKGLSRNVFDDGADKSNDVVQSATEKILDRGKVMKWDTNADHIINEYQSAHVEIEKSTLPPIVRMSFFAIVLFFFSFIAWATFSIIDTTISARGRLSTTVPTISVQATDNSVVRKIDVSIGQRVKKGDLLVTLDETYVKADISSAEMAFTLLESQIQRLLAEMDRKGEDASNDISDSIQQKVFISRRKEYTSKIISFDLDIKSLIQKIATIMNDIKLANEQLKIQKDLEDARTSLFKRNVGSRLNMLMARNERLSVQREYSTLLNSVNNLKSDLEAKRAARQAFISGWFSKIGVELSQFTKERDAKREELVKLQRRKKNVKIVSPADGVIIEIKNIFVGALVKEGVAIMSLVPGNVPLTVELDVNPRDIGNLMLGARVSVKLDALPYQKYGEILGKISFISEDTIDQSLDGKPGTYYRARSSILSNELKNLPNNFRLVPGMLLTGDIRAGRRRLITYFIYPIIRTISTSFSEPGR